MSVCTLKNANIFLDIKTAIGRYRILCKPKALDMFRKQLKKPQVSHLFGLKPPRKQEVKVKV